MRQLADAYLHQSDLAAAEPLCQRALQSSREELGDDHELTLMLCIKNKDATPKPRRSFRSV